MFDNILICVDGSEIAQRAVQVGAEISAKFGSKAHILTVVRPYNVSPELKRFLQAENLMGEPKYVLDEMTKKIISETRKMAIDAGAEKVETHVVEGKPARTIIEFAADNNIDHIVIGSRGVGEVEAALLGSVSHKVSSLAKCAVTIVR